jgi:4-hydroxy-tetrahydrodipicolinate synthase
MPKGLFQMRKLVFTGSAPAVITPFNSSGIDFNKLEELIEFQIREGSDAIVVCGTTGEASTMTDEEHQEAIRFTVEKAHGRIPVIAGTGSNDTKYAVWLTEYAEAAGADAALSVTPYYNKTTQQGLYMHFKAIAESVKIPVIIYNVPSRTNLNIDPPTLQRLCEFENIAGIKECNLAQVGDIMNLCGDDFTVYSGEDAFILPLLSLGGKGVISVMANIIPNDTHKMVVKFLNGDLEGAKRLQLASLPLIKALFVEVSPVPVKTAMNLMGMNAGDVRLPLVEMSDTNLEYLRQALKNYGLLK